MKNLYISALAFLTMFLTCPTASAQDDPSDDNPDTEWVGIGTGAYQPGILDAYSEYSELMEAAVYESNTTPGKYKFVPTPPASGLTVVYEIVVHTEDPDMVWCEPAYFFWGITNLPATHKVPENGWDYLDNYGKLQDGAITFTTPDSFVIVDWGGRSDSNSEGKFALYLPGSKIPGSDPILYDTWTAMGTGKYTEGFVDCEYEAGKTWDVEIEKSVEHPGCYRFKPYPEGNPSCPKLPEVADVYVYINAENPMEVYTVDFTLLNNQGKGYKIQHRAITKNAPEYEYYGTLEDNVITFPANSHIATVIGIAGAGSMYTNTSGKATIALPGSEYGDYYLKAVHPACTTSGADGFCNFPFRIEGGADVVAAGVVVEPGLKTADSIDINSYMQNEVQAYPRDLFNFDLNMNFPVVSDIYGTNRWTMILIALDGQQKAHGYTLSTFFTPEDDSKWEPYYNAEFNDIILSPGYFSGGTYDVVVEQKKGVPGFYRVVNPFKSHPSIIGTDEYNSCKSGHNHYLYIHAEDPDYVYIEESPVGLNFDWGDVIASSAVGSLLNQGMTLAEIKAAGTPAGKKSGDNITFDTDALKLFETSFSNMALQNCSSGLLLRLTTPSAGVEGVTVETSEAEYFDLQGLRVAEPVKGQLYIKRHEGKTEKVIF